MCFDGDIDHVLEQVKKCQNDEKRRRLLDPAGACEVCSEVKSIALNGQEPECRCRLRQKIKLENQMEFFCQEADYHKRRHDQSSYAVSTRDTSKANRHGE